MLNMKKIMNANRWTDETRMEAYLWDTDMDTATREELEFELASAGMLIGSWDTERNVPAITVTKETLERIAYQDRLKKYQEAKDKEEIEKKRKQQEAVVEYQKAIKGLSEKQIEELRQKGRNWLSDGFKSFAEFIQNETQKAVNKSVSQMNDIKLQIQIKKLENKIKALEARKAKKAKKGKK